MLKIRLFSSKAIKWAASPGCLSRGINGAEIYDETYKAVQLIEQKGALQAVAGYGPTGLTFFWYTAIHSVEENHL